MKATPQTSKRGFTTGFAPSEDDLYKCVQCGFCLNSCPTYLETGLEAESPRGRLTLMKAVNEGRLEMTPTVTKHWDLCLQCRACEVACPSGVPYGRIMMGVRAEMREHADRSMREKTARSIGFNLILARPKLMRMFGTATKLLQKSGISESMRNGTLAGTFPVRWREMESAMPTMDERFFVPDGRVLKPMGEIKARVVMLGGCVMSMMDATTLEATVRVLVHNGFEVHIPEDQGCCGSLNFHAGERATAREMAMRNVQSMLASDPDYIVSASAGCNSTMKEYEELMPGDANVIEFAHRTRDLHELLVEHGFEMPTGRIDRKVVFQDPCHLLSTQRISDAPRKLLRSIPGLELVQVAEPTICCGSAGTYSVFEREMSMRLGDRKARNVIASGAALVATGNPGCAAQLRSSLQRANSDIELRYVVDLLDEAYLAGGDYLHPTAMGAGSSAKV